MRSSDAPCHALVVAGGVAANLYLRQRLDATAAALSLTLVAPPLDLCTDNAIMVAWAGIERLRLGKVDDQSVPARARWSLDELTPPA
jgi:N6-L-threonylcarbamoyladenine synthase